MITTAPPHLAAARPVTMPLRVRGGVAAMAIVVALGGAIAWWGSSAAPGADTGTAIVLEHRGGTQVVSVVDGPEPGRHVVTWARDVPRGERFTVGLVGECGCSPWPARRVQADGPRSPTSVGLGVLLAGLGAVGLLLLGLLVSVMARARRRSAAVVGRGSGLLVHLLPFWPPRGGVLNAELWPVEGDAPLGVVHLSRADRGFDPTQPFAAWGPLVPGQPIALTSVDGRQLVLPGGPLLAALPPGPPGPITASANEILGWPTRIGPGHRRDVTALDAALDDLDRGTSRIACTSSIAMGLAVGAMLAPLPGIARLAVVGIALVTVLSALPSARHLRDPVRALVRQAVGPGQPRLVAHVSLALTVARRPLR